MFVLVLIDLYLFVLDWRSTLYKHNAKKSRIFIQTGVSSQIRDSQSLSFCIFIQWLYIYTFCIVSHKPENRLSSPLVHNRNPPCKQVPRRMFTTYGDGCEQPLKQMFTRTSALVHTAVCIEKKEESYVCMNIQRMLSCRGCKIYGMRKSTDAGFVTMDCCFSLMLRVQGLRFKVQGRVSDLM